MLTITLPARRSSDPITWAPEPAPPDLFRGVRYGLLVVAVPWLILWWVLT